MTEAALAGLRADLAMLACGVRTQFTHAGEREYLSSIAGCALCRRPQSSMDGDGIGAITVIDQADAAG